MAKAIQSGAWVPPPDGPVEFAFLEGSKLFATWYPFSRPYVFLFDLGVGFLNVAGGNWNSIRATAAGETSGTVLRQFALMPGNAAAAGRIGGYGGYVADKMIGGAQDKVREDRSPTGRTRTLCSERGAC